jgi:hypothetical protein
MEVAGRGGGGGGGLPTSLDFSINSDWNSMPSLPEYLQHARRLFGFSLAVSRYCEMSHGQILPELPYGRESLTIATLK